MSRLLRFSATLAVLGVLVAIMSPHGGRLDSYGGHFDRKTGTYHFVFRYAP